MGLGSGIQDPGSGKNLLRIPESKRHRIPDLDPQHCLKGTSNALKTRKVVTNVLEGLQAGLQVGHLGLQLTDPLLVLGLPLPDEGEEAGLLLHLPLLDAQVQPHLLQLLLQPQVLLHQRFILLERGRHLCLCQNSEVGNMFYKSFPGILHATQREERLRVGGIGKTLCTCNGLIAQLSTKWSIQCALAHFSKHS
jgi:hypothetical protein